MIFIRRKSKVGRPSINRQQYYQQIPQFSSKSDNAFLQRSSLQTADMAHRYMGQTIIVYCAVTENQLNAGKPRLTQVVKSLKFDKKVHYNMRN